VDGRRHDPLGARYQHNIGEADRDLAVPHDRATDRKFVDSPLEGRVKSELVSEIRFPAPREN
jgi:7,8-dihydro-6-hydroxymethylpterin-pyrophosphokinase